MQHLRWLVAAGLILLVARCCFHQPAPAGAPFQPYNHAPLKRDLLLQPDEEEEGRPLEGAPFAEKRWPAPWYEGMLPKDVTHLKKGLCLQKKLSKQPLLLRRRDHSPNLKAIHAALCFPLLSRGMVRLDNLAVPPRPELGEELVKKAFHFGDWRHLYTNEELFEMFRIPKSLATKLYKQMQVFHEVCLQFNIPYFLDGGNQLAIARGTYGLIAWDDDLDVIVPKTHKDLLMSDAVQAEFHKRGYTVMTSQKHKDLFQPYDPLHPNAWNLSQGFIDVFYGDNQADGWWGYPWGNHPFWIRQSEYRDTEDVPFGPVTARVLKAAKTVVARYYGPDWETPLLTHTHLWRPDPRAASIDLELEPIEFPKKPAYFRPAEWDPNAFPPHSSVC